MSTGNCIPIKAIERGGIQLVPSWRRFSSWHWD